MKAQLTPDSYLAMGLGGGGFGWLALLLAPLALLQGRYRRRNAAWLFVLGAQLLFIVRAGSDWAPGFRFGVPCLPLLFALLVEVIALAATLARRHQRLAGLDLGRCSGRPDLARRAARIRGDSARVRVT